MLLSRFSIHPPAVVLFSLDRMGHTALVLPHHPPDQAAALTPHHASLERDAGRACSRSRKA